MSIVVRLLLPAYLMLLAAVPAPALSADSHPCATVVGAAERLSCYDKAFPPPPEVHAAATRKATEDFGLAKAGAPSPAPGQESAAADPASIRSRVASVDAGAGRRRITLEGGQVWTLAEGTSSGPLRPGDEVVVRKGLLGSYLLTTPAGVTLRVRRTR